MPKTQTKIANEDVDEEFLVDSRLHKTDGKNSTSVLFKSNKQHYSDKERTKMKSSSISMSQEAAQSIANALTSASSAHLTNIVENRDNLLFENAKRTRTKLPDFYALRADLYTLKEEDMYGSTAAAAGASGAASTMTNSRLEKRDANVTSIIMNNNNQQNEASLLTRSNGNLLPSKLDKDDDNMDNVSYNSDETNDLVNEANSYYMQDDELVENMKIFFAQPRYHINLEADLALENSKNLSRSNTSRDLDFPNLLEDEEVKKDHSNEAVYFDQCRKQKIIPASYFVRHMNDQILSLKHHGLGAPGVRPVSAALTNNSIVTKLDLSDNWLGSDGALYISKMLRDNCSITDLNLSDNRLSTRGADLLKDALKQSSCLTHLTLQGNNFDDSTAPIWADIILNTIKIEYLDLSHNNFGEESGKIFGSAISENTSIKTFIINWNNIRRKGAIAIAKGLANNQGIRKFEIGWNGLSQDGAKAFFKTIKENETLEELDLSNNRIATEGAVYIAKALMANQTLRVLKMGMNPMESAGCFSIIKTLQKNPNSKLEVIDFSEIIVDKYFRDEYKNFQVIFPNTKVITGCDGVPLKPKVKIHPVVKLRNYVEKHNVKLIDIFNKFDKDGSMTVTRDEFKQGLLSLGINLNEDELNQLMTELDSDQDGEINYRNLVRLTATFA